MSAISTYLAALTLQQTINLFTPSSSGSVALTLDDITFNSVEIPENLAGVGGTQTLVMHDFPGGDRTIQAMGAFPATVIWEGWLIGANAMARSSQIDRKRATGTEVIVSYAAFRWKGYVKEYSAQIKNQSMIRYRVVFEPEVDLSSSASIAPAAASNNVLMGVAISSLQAVAAGGNGLALPASLVGPVGTLLSQTTTALTAAGGDIANLATSDVQQIQSSSTAVTTAAQPLVAGSDPTQASPAIDASTQAIAISALATGTQPAQTVEIVTNPNLYQLAAKYYGDATQWDYIGEANGLTDPMPIGQYTLVIPPQLGSNPTSMATPLQ